MLLRNGFVLVPIDKATGNIALICKQFYASVIEKEVGIGLNNGTNTYIEINNNSKDEIINTDIEIPNLNFVLIILPWTILVCEICIGCQKYIKHLSRLDLLLSLLSQQLSP